MPEYLPLGDTQRIDYTTIFRLIARMIVPDKVADVKGFLSFESFARRDYRMILNDHDSTRSGDTGIPS
jgi:hypothetical protein